MSAPGHCRHCGAECEGGQVTPGGVAHYAHASYQKHAVLRWADGHCPACNEAERIAAALEAAAGPPGTVSLGAYSPQHFAAMIRSGEL